MANNQPFKLNSGLSVTSVFETSVPVTEESYVFNGPWPTLTDTTSFTIPSAYVGANGNKGLFFKPDGLQMYFISNDIFGGEAFIYQFTLSTAWDVTTASYTAVSGDNIDSGNYLGETEGLKFSPDGTKAYVFSYIAQLMVQYPLTTPWDISTLSNSTRVEVSWPTIIGAGFNVQGGTFIDGGKRLILSHTSVPTSSPDFYEITLSEPYNIATAVYYSVTYDYTGANNDAGPWTDFAFNSTGTIAVGVNSTKTSDFSFLRTDPNSPWDLSTLTQNPPSGGSWSPRFNITGIANPEGIFIHPDNTKVFVIDGSSDKIHELATNTSTSTWDTDFRNYKIDLSQGNYFTKLLTHNTRLEFDNPPPDGQVGSFIMEITGNSEGYDISNLTYDSSNYKEFTTRVRQIEFGPEGRSVSFAGYKFANSLHQYPLSEPYNLLTMDPKKYVRINMNTTAYGSQTYCYSFYFKPDGTSVYLMGFSASPDIIQVNLSTPFDLNTASSSYDAILAVGADMKRIEFSPDGLTLFIHYMSSQDLVGHPLTTAWDITTVDLLDTSNSYTLTTDVAVSGTIMSGRFSPDGKEYYASEGWQSSSTNHKMHMFVLTTPYDLTTMSYDSSSVTYNSLKSTILVPGSVTFSEDGKKLYVTDDGADDTVHVFNVAPSSTPDDFYISWPDNIRWNKGLVPITPATGETDQYAFITTDGGKTYYGKVLGENI
jgi:sugar lactone lactonase YvrE